MATQVASLYGLLTLNDSDFTRKLQSANSGLAGLGSTLRGLGANIALATAPLAVGFGFGIRAAADFENVMTEIGARAGLTADEIQRVSDYSLQMGADTMFSGTQAAEAFLQLVTSGSSVEEAFAILPSVLDGAAASGADLGATADGLTNIMASFGLGADDAAAAIDSLARASGSSSAKMPQLFAAFDNVGGSAAAMGLSVDRTSAIFALFAERGISGAEAGTQLRSMLTNLQRPTTANRKAWEKLGTSLYDADGNARDFAVVLEEMKEGMEGLSMEEQNRLMQDLAGSYGVLGLQALLSGDSIEDMEAAMAEAASASQVAEARMNTWNGATDSLMGSIETLMITALLPFMQDVLTPIVGQITEVINQVVNWAKENPELTQAIVAFGAALVVIGPLLIAAGGAIAVVSGALGMLLSPIGLAIGAAVAIGAAYATNFGGIRDFINNTVRPALDTFFGFLAGVWEQVRPALQNLADWFNVSALPAIKKFIEGPVTTAIQGFIDLLAGIWDTVRPALSSFANWFNVSALPAVRDFIEGPVTTAIQDFINLISGIWVVVQPALASFADWFNVSALPAIKTFVEGPVTTAIRGFINLVGGIWNSVSSALGSLKDWFVTTGLPAAMEYITGTVIPNIQTFIDTLVGIWESVQGPLNDLKNGFDRIMADILSFIQPIIDAINELIGGIGEAVGLTTGNNNYGEMTGPGLGGLDGRADGGPVMGGTPYIVGERGPELFVPRGNGDIIPNEALGGVQIASVVIYANDAAGGRAAAESFEAQLVALRRQRG